MAWSPHNERISTVILKFKWLYRIGVVTVSVSFLCSNEQQHVVETGAINTATMTSFAMFNVAAAMLWVYIVQCKRNKITRVLPCCAYNYNNVPETYAVDYIISPIYNLT